MSKHKHRELYAYSNSHCESCGNVVSQERAKECMATGERVLCYHCRPIAKATGTLKARPMGGLVDPPPAKVVLEALRKAQAGQNGAVHLPEVMAAIPEGLREWLPADDVLRHLTHLVYRGDAVCGQEPETFLAV